jgi:hypothetical protein
MSHRPPLYFTCILKKITIIYFHTSRSPRFNPLCQRTSSGLIAIKREIKQITISIIRSFSSPLITKINTTTKNTQPGSQWITENLTTRPSIRTDNGIVRINRILSLIFYIWSRTNQQLPLSQRPRSPLEKSNRTNTSNRFKRPRLWNQAYPRTNHIQKLQL